MAQRTNIRQDRKITKVDNLKPNKQAMIKALEKSLGVVTNACKKAKISREAHYKWLATDEEYKRQVLDVKEISIDFVESKMFQAINNGETSLVKYYLSTQGKKRGYVERQEVVQTDTEGNLIAPILKIEIVQPKDD